MKSYKEKFQEKLNEEILGFREGVLALSGQEIYDNAYKIYFYEFMYNYLYSEKFTAAECQSHVGRYESAEHLHLVQRRADPAVHIFFR